MYQNQIKITGNWFSVIITIISIVPCRHYYYYYYIIFVIAMLHHVVIIILCCCCFRLLVLRKGFESVFDTVPHLQWTKMKSNRKSETLLLIQITGDKKCVFLYTWLSYSCHISIQHLCAMGAMWLCFVLYIFIVLSNYNKT